MFSQSNQGLNGLNKANFDGLGNSSNNGLTTDVKTAAIAGQKNQLCDPLNSLQNSFRSSSEIVTDPDGNPVTGFISGTTNTDTIVLSMNGAIDFNTGIDSPIDTPNSPIPNLALDPALTTPESLSFNLTDTSDWFSQTFTDQAISTLVRKLYSDDNHLTRSDVITIFESMEKDGIVSTTEYLDSQILVADGALLGMAESVQVLAGKVAGHSAANARYQGFALGDLHAGSSATQLEALVDKWFLGGDLPASSVAGNPATGDPAKHITYGWASGKLFGNDNGISLTDVNQGAVGDCYFLAALDAMVLQNPSAIQNMFTDNGDGTFTVRLFAEQNGTPIAADYVTVNRFLPLSVSIGDTTGRQFAAWDNQDMGIWVALAEKAYAQFAEEGFAQRPTDATGYVANSYWSIANGEPAFAMTAISGRQAGFYNNYPDTLPGVPDPGHWGSLLNPVQIAVALANGWAVTAATTGTSDAQIDPLTGVVFNHAYTVVSVDLSTQSILMRNPWGDTNAIVNGVSTGDRDGFKVVSFDEYYRDFIEVELG